MTPEMLITSTFFVVAIAIFCIGRMVIGVRNRYPDSTRRRQLALGRLNYGFARVIPCTQKKREKLKSDLVRAGYLGHHAVDEFLALRNAAIVAWLIAMGFVVALLMEPASDFTLALITAGVGWVILYSLPSLIIGIQASRRVERIKYSLPDALDMVNMMVTGGLPLIRALNRASQELADSHPDIACELAIINHQASAGSINQALEQFGQRINEPDVVALATLVQHADELGGNVSSAFSDYADGVRRARRQKAEERGNKASVKLLFPVVLFLAPPIYILLLGPAMLEMRNFLTRENQSGGVLDQETRVVATEQLEAARRLPEQAEATPNEFLP